MARYFNINWLRVWVVLCITALLCACTSGISSSITANSQSMLAALPGTSYEILMPPQAMQKKIGALMKAGRAPSYIPMPAQKIASICGHREWVVLGCVFETKVGKTIFIASSARGETKRMLLVHEYAHYLYNWRH